MTHQNTNNLHHQLKIFRLTHPYTHRPIANVNWQYILCGHGKEALLILPGVTGLAETAFQYINRLEHTYRIISPNYPASVTTVAQLVDGLISILTAENIHKAHVIGGSYGGILAQCLIRRHPDSVGKLILDHVSIPLVARANTYQTYNKILSLLPLTFTRTSLQLTKTLSLLRLPTQRTFWSSYYHELIAALIKDDYLSRIQVSIDFDQHYTFTSNDLSHWPGKILILEADNDTLVPLQEREALKQLYPQAQVYTFQGTSHFAWITKCEELLCTIEHFLQEKT